MMVNIPKPATCGVRVKRHRSHQQRGRRVHKASAFPIYNIDRPFEQRRNIFLKPSITPTPIRAAGSISIKMSVSLSDGCRPVLGSRTALHEQRHALGARLVIRYRAIMSCRSIRLSYHIG